MFDAVTLFISIMPSKKMTKRSLISEMDQSVRRMLKLIEEDGDSFAKKAEMYYQKRPELVSLVEEFYRMYRSLAERYDHVTGELRKNIPSDLQSQGSGISDIMSEPPSTWPSPAPEQRLSHRKSGPRAAGFEFFLGSGGSSSDIYQKEGDESSTLTDSESESDDSSVNNYSGLLGNGVDQVVSRKVIELEVELREMKEKLRMQQDENGDASSRVVRNENSEDLLARIAGYEQELIIANGRIRLSEEDIARLNIELQKYKTLELTNNLQAEFSLPTKRNAKNREAELEFEKNQATHLQESIEGQAGALDSNSKVQALVEELRITKERLQDSEKEIASLKHQLEGDRPSVKINNLQDELALAHKDINTWKTKLNAEKREVSKLQERIARMKTSLLDRDHEIRELKIAVSDAEQKIFPEKAQIKTEISRLVEEKTSLEEKLREWESRGRFLEDEIRKLQAEKIETAERLNHEIGLLKADIADRDNCIENLDKCLTALKLERDELNVNVLSLKAEVVSRDARIDQVDKHLQQLHVEHVELISGAEDAHKLVDELRSKANDMEGEIERQRIVILEGAEKKREAIRQLCLSLEHYRNGYHMLRQAFTGNKRAPVLAT